MSYSTVSTTGINPYSNTSATFHDGFADTFYDQTIFDKLSASKLVATDGSKQLVSTNFTSNATASTVVSRDSSGNSSFNSISLSGLSTYPGITSTGNVVIMHGNEVKTIPMSDQNIAYNLVCRTSNGNVNVGYLSCYRIRPGSNLLYSLGDVTFKWSSVYTRNITDDGSQVIIGSHCLPDADGTRDLGSASKQWQNIYSVNALTVSDQVLKKDIISDETNYYDIIDGVRVVKYNWVSNENADEENPSEIGVIAQELELVIPQLVTTQNKVDVVPNYDEEGNQLDPTVVNSGTRKFVNYNQFIPILISCIQAMKTEISDLKERISDLEIIVSGIPE